MTTPLPQMASDLGSRRGDEQALVVRARAGDDAAFSVLVDRYRRRIYAKVKAILRSDEAAEDACQETFLRAYRNLCAVREPGAFLGWLLTIATNVCKDELQASHRIVAEVMPEGLEELADRADDFERSDLRADLTSLIAELSPRMSVLARLHYLQGLGQDDIASNLGIPLGTVSGTLSRARNEIRARFERNRQREAGLTPGGLRVRTQGVLATLCPFCGRHRLEWRRSILPGDSDRVETYCPGCSSALPGAMTCWLLSKGVDVHAEEFFLSGHRAALQIARGALSHSRYCPTCGARLMRLPPFVSHAWRPGEARVAWRCTKCAYEADSAVVGLLLGSAPVQRFWRENEAVVIEDRDKWVRVGGSGCWRLHYRSLRNQAHLAVVADTSSLRVLAADVDYGRRSISLT